MLTLPILEINAQGTRLILNLRDVAVTKEIETVLPGLTLEFNVQPRARAVPVIGMAHTSGPCILRERNQFPCPKCEHL